MVASISHDLRTPLTSNSGSASILLDQDSNIEEQQKQKLYLDIYDDSMWLINLVENLLSVTRIENGTMNLNMQPELLSDVIGEAMKHINRRNVDHHLSIVEEDDLLVANMDAKLIMQVLINLVDNAIKYTDVGSHITISTWKQNDEVFIEVQDDGWGIPDEQKAKLFEMFYTVENQVADGKRGMGLGLALCKSIVEVADQEVHLMPMEYGILCLLERNVGKVLTHHYILDKVWTHAIESDLASLRVYVASLRKKIDRNHKEMKYIQTHIGVGYRMVKIEND